MEELNREVQIMMRNLNELTLVIEKLKVNVDKLVISQARKKDIKAVKEKQTKKTTPNKSVSMKLTKPTAFDTVIRIIQMNSEGASVDQIEKETGFDAKKISNIIYKANKPGLIKSLKNVVYRKPGKTNYKNHQQEIDKQESRIELKATEKKSKIKSSPPAGSQVTTNYTAASEWTKCSICGVTLKKKNLDKHRRNQHNKKKKTQKIVLLKNDLQSELKKSLSSKRPTFTIPSRSTTIKGGCPGCGSVYGCYCK